MPAGKPHRALAGIADAYTFIIVAGGVEALAGTLLRRPIPVGLIALVAAAIIAFAIAYHVAASAMAPFLTPGERMFGRVRTPQGKEWRNPYQMNRAPWFILTFLTLIVAGNTWDRLSLGAIYELSIVAGKALMVAVLLGGLMMIGSGRRIGAIAVAAIYVISSASLQFQPPENLSPSLVSGLSAFGYAIAAATLILAWIYRPRDRAPVAPVPSPAAE